MTGSFWESRPPAVSVPVSLLCSLGQDQRCPLSLRRAVLLIPIQSVPALIQCILSAAHLAAALVGTYPSPWFLAPLLLPVCVFVVYLIPDR